MNWGQVTPYYAGPRRVVIVDKLRHEVIQVPLAEDNELAQALQLDRLNEPLASAVQIWARHWQRIGPGSATAVNGGPKVRRGGVIRIWRLPPLSGLDDSQDGPLGVGWQRRPSLGQAGQSGVGWGVFVTN